MEKKLNLILNGKEFSFDTAKVDRKKLYGWTETIVLDGEGKTCYSAIIDETGNNIIPKGAVGLGIISSNGNWVDRKDLIAVSQEGNKINIVPSSFNQKIELTKTVTPEEYLEYAITFVYQLIGDGIEKLCELIKDDIYTFIFNYQDDYEGTPAFLINSNGRLFLTAGNRMDFSFIGREEIIPEISEEESSESEDEELDFSLMWGFIDENDKYIRW